MARNKVILFLTVLVIAAGGLAYFWFDQPRRTIEGFAGDLYHQRYDEAAGMLRAPSALSVDSNGGLVVVDKAGRSITVPKAALPFKVLGGEMKQYLWSMGGDGGPEHDFKMIALGPSTDGTLHSPPVILYLGVAGAKVTIEDVER